VVAHPLDGLMMRVVGLEQEEGGAPGGAENVRLVREGGGGGGGGVMMIMVVDPGAVKGALGGDG
jgi:hypothetical protein